MIKIAVVVLMLISFLWNCFEMILGNRSLKNPIPENVKDVYDHEEYIKWRTYTGDKQKLELYRTVCIFVVELILLLTDSYARFATLFPANLYMQTFSVILLNSVVTMIVGLPFEIRDTFVIEQKYGFNRSTKKTFIVDCIRNLIVELLLGNIAMAVFSLLYKLLGDWVILVFAVVFILVMMLIVLLVPVFTRMVNKFTPLEEGELREKLTALLTSHNYKVRAIEVMDASKRSSKMNAYFTGFGPMKTIVLYDTLVEAVTPDQLCAVFAHELGHGLNKDNSKSQFFTIIQGFLIAICALLVVRTESVYTAFGFDGVNYGMAFVLIGVLMNIVSIVIGLVRNKVSCKMEFRADAQAVKEGYGPALRDALKILAKGNFCDLSPDPLLVKLTYDHPPIHERIAAIDAVEKSMNK